MSYAYQIVIVTQSERYTPAAVHVSAFTRAGHPGVRRFSEQVVESGRIVAYVRLPPSASRMHARVLELARGGRGGNAQGDRG